MKNIYKRINVSFFLYVFIFLSLISGLFWNVLILFLIIIFHELGHVITSKYYGWNIEKIDFTILGGYMTFNNAQNRPLKEEFIVGISGVLFQTLFYFFCMFLYKNSILSIKTFSLIKTYNYTILIFNLLPIVPLDGFRLLNLFYSSIFSYKKSMYLSFTTSLISMALFGAFFMLKSVNAFIIILFMIVKIYNYYKDIPYMFNNYLLVRYFEHKLYNKNNYVDGCDINMIKRYKNNYFKEKNRYVSEREILRKRFD